MIPALPVEEKPFEIPTFDPNTPSIPEDGVDLMDYVKGIAASFPSMAASLHGAAQYVGGKTGLWSGEEDGNFAQARRKADEWANSILDTQSAAAKRASRSEVLSLNDNSMWTQGIGHAAAALGLKVAGSTASLATMAASLPVAAIARGIGLAQAAATTVGALAGGGAGGVLTAGDIFNEITNDIMKQSDAQLMEENEVYRGFRGMGLSEEDAKEKIREHAVGNRPLYMGAITLLTSQFGIDRFIGGGLREGGRGVLKRGAIAAGGEAIGEGLEEGAQEFLRQEGEEDARAATAPKDWSQIAEKGTEGALVGGFMGGAIGAAARQPRAPVKGVDADVDAALAPPLPNERLAPEKAATAEPSSTTPGPDEIAAQLATVPADIQAAMGLNEFGEEDVDAGLDTEDAPLIEASAGPVAETAPATVREEAVALPEPQPETTPPPLPPVDVVTPQVREAITVPAEETVTPETPAPALTPVAEAFLAEEATPTAPEPQTAVLEAPEPKTKGRRLLEDVAERKAAAEKAKRERAGPRVSKPEAARIASGEQAVTALPTDEVTFGTPEDMKRVYALGAKIAKAAEKNGAEMPELWQRILATKGVKKGKKPAELKAQYMAARRELAAQTVPVSEVTRGVGEVRKVERAKSDEAAVTRVKNILTATEGQQSFTDIDAARSYIDSLAKRADQLAIPSKRGNADDHLLHIANARALVGGKGSRAQVADFMVNDVALRSGNMSGFVREARSAQQEKRNASYDEQESGERGGDRPAEPDTAMSPEDALIAQEEPVEDSDVEIEVDDEPLPEARDRPPVRVDVATAVRTGVDRTGTFGFQTKSKGRQKLTPPGKPPANVKELLARKVPRSEPEAREVLNEMVREEARVEVQETAPEPRVKTGDVKPLKLSPRAKVNDDVRARAELPRSIRTLTLSQALSEVLIDNPAPVTRDERVSTVLQGYITKRIRSLAPNFRVRVLDKATAAEEWDALPDNQGIPGGMVEGWYDFNRDEIVIRADKFDSRTVLHEGVHAIYMAALEVNTVERARIGELLEEVSSAYIMDKIALGETDGPLPYGFTDVHEFLSEAWSNPDFQKLLAETQLSKAFRRKHGIGPVKREIATAWSFLIDSVRRIAFGAAKDIPYTAIEDIVRVTESLDRSAVSGERRYGAPVLPKQEGGQEINYQAYLSDRVAARSGAFRTGARKVKLRVATLGQIVQYAAKYFQTGSNGNPMDRFYEGLQRMGRDGELFAQESNKFAERFLRMKITLPDVAERVARILVDATMAGVNIGPNADNSHLGKDAARYYQSKATLARLQSAYDRLAATNPEAAKFIDEAIEFYRRQHNTTTELLVQNLLVSHSERLLAEGGSALTDKQQSDLTAKVLAGTLTQEDAKLVNDEGVFKTLKNATELRHVKGTYIPLMRHGDHVVRTTDKLGNLHGGKVISNDGKVAVIEFEGTNDRKGEKVTRERYKAFATDPDNVQLITSVGKVRVLPNGKVVSEVDARGQDHKIIYRVRVQLQGLHFFDTATEAETFIQDANKSGEYAAIDQRPLARANQNIQADLSNTQLRALAGAFKNRTDLTDAQKTMLGAAIEQAAIRLSTGNRIKRSSLKRNNVYGASQDMARNFVEYGQNAGRYYAKVKHMKTVRDALDEMHKLVGKVGVKDADIQNHVLNEVERRINQNDNMNPSRPSQWLNNIMVLSFLDKLASPAYSTLNGMQVALVTAPVLGGRHGNARTLVAMTRAYNDIGVGSATVAGLANTGRAIGGINRLSIDTTDPVDSIRRNLAKVKDDGAQLVEVLDYLQERNLLGNEAGFEITSAIAGNKKWFGTGLAKVDRAARQLPTAMEAINRATSAVMAYRLGRADGMSHEAARNYAYTTVQNTQGDYSAINAPAFFNHPVGRIAFQFKKYAQMMSFLLHDMAKRALTNPSNEERKVARKQIYNIMATQVMFAGALGLPGLELIKGFATVGALFGIGGGYDDLERKLRKLFDDSLGKTWGELVSRGIASRAIGIDISSRVGLADMWLPFEGPKTNDAEGIAGYIGRAISGAPGSLLLNDWFGAIKDAGNGDWAKAASKAIPLKIIADSIKGAHGVYKGDMTLWEGVQQGVGFRSARLAEKGEAIGAGIDKAKDKMAEKKRLTKLYLDADTKGERVKIKVMIDRHNKASDTTLAQKIVGLDKVLAKRDAERRTLREGR